VAGVHNKNLKLKKVIHKKGITVKTVWLFGPGFPTHYPKKLALVIFNHHTISNNTYKKIEQPWQIIIMQTSKALYSFSLSTSPILPIRYPLFIYSIFCNFLFKLNQSTK